MSATASSPLWPAATLDPAHVVVTEPMPGSPFPVHYMYVEMADGAYIPIALRKPEGPGPFPIILCATGNGGGGMGMLREHVETKNWTIERFLEAGYAAAWMRYRAEVDYAYDKIGKLIESGRQGRQLLNRGPLEYEDAIAVAEYVKTLPFIDGDRLGYIGVSHGGEMAFKITSEYHGFRAMVASEPAAHEFLRLKPDETAQIDPKTGLLNVEKMLMREASKVRPRITEEVARQRASARSKRRSSCRAATATSCKAFSVSATICCTKPAKRRSGRVMTTTCTVSSIRCATPMVPIYRTTCSVRPWLTRSPFLTNLCRIIPRHRGQWPPRPGAFPTRSRPLVFLAIAPGDIICR